MNDNELKKLVICYSFEGNTKFIAEVMSEAIGADILEIKPKKELPSKGFSKYFWGGRQVIMKKKPELMPLEVNPLDYDLIIMGTPIWAGSVTPPIATLLATVDFKGKLVGLYNCHASKQGKPLMSMREQLKDSPIIGEIDFSNPLTKDKDRSVIRAREWARDFQLKGTDVFNSMK